MKVSCGCILSLKEVDLRLKLEADLSSNPPNILEIASPIVKLIKLTLSDRNVNLNFLSQLPGVLLQLLTWN